MKTVNNYTNKHSYTAPTVEIVLLDNEISLALASAPPVSGHEAVLTPVFTNIDPFKDSQA